MSSVGGKKSNGIRMCHQGVRGHSTNSLVYVYHVGVSLGIKREKNKNKNKQISYNVQE